MHSSLAERRRVVVAGTEERAVTIAACVAAASLFVPLLVPISTGRIFAIDDLSVFHLPLRMLYAQALQRGDSLLWTSNLFGGFYVLAEGQHGPLHPLHLLLYRTLSLSIAYNLELILSYAAAFCGMAVFLRRAGIGTAATVVGATMFTFSGFNMLRFSQMNVVAVAAHVPWLLVALDALLTDRRQHWTRARAFALLALAIGSEILIGFPQAVWFSVLVCGVYAIVQISSGVPAARLALPLVAGVCGVAVGGAQLLPTFDHLSQSLRAVVSVDFFRTFSLHPFNLLQLWSPYLFSRRAYFLPAEPFPQEFIVYTGAFATIALFWVLSRRSSPSTRVLRTTGIALVLIGLTLAMGGYVGVNEYLSALPVIGQFRAPSRYLLLMHLGLAILAAVCFDELRSAPARPATPQLRAWSVWLPLVLSLVTAMLVWTGVAGSLVGHSASVPTAPGAALGILLIGITTLFVAEAARGIRPALVLLPMVVALDLGLWGYTHVWSTPPQTIDAIARQAVLPRDARHGATVHMVDTDARRNLVVLQGARLFWSYVGLYPSTRLSPEDPLAQRLGGVEWVWQASEWVPTDDPMPRVRTLAHVVESTAAARDLQSIDMTRTALVSEPVGNIDDTATAITKMRTDAPGRMDVDVTSTGRLLLVTTERYQTGWVASADARSFQALAVYGDFLGVVIEPGSYTLSLRFAPRSASNGLLLSSLGLALTAMITGALWVSTRRAAELDSR